MNLREGGALSPDSAVVTKNGGGSECVAGLAFNVAHQMLIDVSLPRHGTWLDEWINELYKLIELFVFVFVCVNEKKFVGAVFED